MQLGFVDLLIAAAMRAGAAHAARAIADPSPITGSSRCGHR
jgi:hypothetical protein